MAIRVTVSDGIGFKGAYAPDGSLYVTEAPDSGYCGIYAPDGSTYVTVSPGNLFVGYYAPNGSRYVTEDLTEWSGATQVVVVTGSLGNTPDLSLPFFEMTPASIAAEGVTAERSGLGWQYDPSGKITTCPNNLALRSQEFDNASWTKSGVTVSANSAPDPLGGNTADTLTFTATGSFQVAAQSVNVTAGANYIQSVWLAGSGTISLDTGTGSSGVLAVTLTPTLTRYSVVQSPTSTFVSFRICSRPGNTATTVIAWGFQLEQVTYETSPRTYNPTTSAAYYGPRLDYDPVTLAAKGLLVEEARTNLLLRSQELGTTPWDVSAAFNMTGVTADAVAAPDGTTTADLLLENASTGLHAAYYTTTFSDAAVKTFSVFLKARERTKFRIQIGASAMAAGVYADVDVVAGTISAATLEAGSYTAGASKIEPVGNGWYRVSVTATTPATAHVVYISPSDATGTRSYTGVATNGFYAWGAQLELGSFATSYIPTTTASVTRTADSVSMTGTAFSSWYSQTEGTFDITFTGMNPNVAPNGYLPLSLSATNSASTSNATRLRVDSAASITWSIFDGSSVAQCAITTAGGLYAAGTEYKTAFGYKANDFNAAVNGTLLTADTSGTVPAPTTLFIMPAMSGWVKELDYYNTRKPDVDLLLMAA